MTTPSLPTSRIRWLLINWGNSSSNSKLKIVQHIYERGLWVVCGHTLHKIIISKLVLTIWFTVYSGPTYCNSLWVQRLPTTADSWGFTTIYVMLFWGWSQAVHHNEREAYRPLVTDESVEVQDFRRITDLFKRICRILYLKSIKTEIKTERSQHVTGWTWKG